MIVLESLPSYLGLGWTIPHLLHLKLRRKAFSSILDTCERLCPFLLELKRWWIVDRCKSNLLDDQRLKHVERLIERERGEDE